jgi:transcriptional antiterminator RfaH
MAFFMHLSNLANRFDTNGDYNRLGNVADKASPKTAPFWADGALPMPILQAEPALFPNGLFDAPLLELDRLWWVMHTKPRQEKALARQLHAQEIRYYLPLNGKRTKIRGKLVPAYVPVFPGYLFLLAEREHLHQALATRRVARHLEVLNQRQLWQELRQIHRLIQSGLPITPELALVPGAKVEMCSGPLAGLRGVIVRSASGNRFVVQVDFIQQGASVLIEDHMLECVRE